jgi:hypothetical protein
MFTNGIFIVDNVDLTVCASMGRSAPRGLFFLGINLPIGALG